MLAQPLFLVKQYWLESTRTELQVNRREVTLLNSRQNGTKTVPMGDSRWIGWLLYIVYIEEAKIFSYSVDAG